VSSPPLLLFASTKHLRQKISPSLKIQNFKKKKLELQTPGTSKKQKIVVMPRVKEPLSLDKKLKVQVGICRRMLKEVEAYQKEVRGPSHRRPAAYSSLDCFSESFIHLFIN